MPTYFPTKVSWSKVGALYMIYVDKVWVGGGWGGGWGEGVDLKMIGGQSQLSHALQWPKLTINIFSDRKSECPSPLLQNRLWNVSGKSEKKLMFCSKLVRRTSSSVMIYHSIESILLCCRPTHSFSISSIESAVSSVLIETNQNLALFFSIGWRAGHMAPTTGGAVYN